ncbi:MAG: pyruvate kinase [Candidatus Wallbacteria bacterium GWC2_49_35]|uniref:Pyruvate kinase n=1 Tax=Candidatus Wallbacteria bacterium GWC2_49_35 TaxID=1817813 RepID=A0A1F7WEE4_9BACT|nr:MAG: pyruvate kinase [Candidatus Wallbacteria bacterium GWC2_49_35]HBC75984.1 pyruvate kinase [Candidatus Wallbacteria bacterium]
MFNLTKIICTIGPSSGNPATITRLMEAGMDVARLNFSHGTHESHLANITMIRQAAKELGCRTAILADLQGPKIRVSKLPDSKPITLTDGAEVTITTRENCFGPDIIPTIYKNLPLDVKAGSTILLDDGLLELKVIEVKSATDILCRVTKGGLLKEKKGINLPDASVSAPPVTEKDFEDLEFALANGVDYVALSFVRHASDIENVKRFIHKKSMNTPVVAKIERPEAVVNIDSILKAADAVMVARGDMGVELAPEKVPRIQKSIIQKCNLEGKPVIVATQMLESMISNPRPTRAEASDIANAILDGTDAIMLSGETASGLYPVEAVKMMSAIAREVEPVIVSRDHELKTRVLNPLYGAADSLCYATGAAAAEIKAKLIVTYTESGSTALLVSKYRPRTPILAITMSEEIGRRVNLYWGVIPTVIEKAASTDRMMQLAEKAALDSGFASPGDYIIITGGVPVGQSGSTNLMKVHKIGLSSAGAAAADRRRVTASCPETGTAVCIDPEKCVGCGICVSCCPFKIFGYQNNKIFINSENVGGCAAEKMCVKKCPAGAISVTVNKND